MGRDSASSAQSKRVGMGIEHGGTGDGGRETVTAGGSGMAAGVKGAGFGETARFWVFRGKQGAWGTFRGCSGGSSSVHRRSMAAGDGLESGG